MHIHFGYLPPHEKPALLVHGGAWAIPSTEHAAHHEGLRQALEKGRSLLQKGTSALEVVTEVVAVMEAHPAFDAGRGSVLNRQGEVELDAGLMDGATLQYGAVAGIKHFLHPIRIAHRVLQKGRREVCFLIGEGAEAFALQEGFSYLPNEALIVPREWERYRTLRESPVFHTSYAFQPPDDSCPKGTVGCVARDASGQLAAATSTGGTPLTWPGRVGDSPLPGCGYYACPEAAVSTTGWGEAIASIVLAGQVAAYIQAGLSPDQAAQKGIQRLATVIKNDRNQGATGGVIVLTPSGAGGWAYSTPHMARGGWQAGKKLWTAL